MHGQGKIVRGFSVNRQMLDNNLEEKSLICQCLMYDTIMTSEKNYSSLLKEETGVL